MDRSFGTMLAALIVGLVSFGCEPGGQYKTAQQIKTEKGHAGHDGHEHGAAGPHGGAIVELGDEEYHGEVVVDAKSHTLTVWLFGKDAKTPAPIAAEHVMVVDEKDAQHQLKAVDPKDGKASQFALADAEKVGAIAKAGYLHGELKLEVDGKPYRGNIDAHFDGSAHGDEKHDEPAANTEDAKPEEPAEPKQDAAEKSEIPDPPAKPE